MIVVRPQEAAISNRRLLIREPVCNCDELRHRPNRIGPHPPLSLRERICDSVSWQLLLLKRFLLPESSPPSRRGFCYSVCWQFHLLKRFLLLESSPLPHAEILLQRVLATSGLETVPSP